MCFTRLVVCISRFFSRKCTSPAPRREQKHRRLYLLASRRSRKAINLSFSLSSACFSESMAVFSFAITVCSSELQAARWRSFSDFSGLVIGGCFTSILSSGAGFTDFHPDAIECSMDLQKHDALECALAFIRLWSCSVERLLPRYLAHLMMLLRTSLVAKWSG